jgi:subtilisin
MSTKKTYIVTFTDPDIDSASMSEVMHVSADALQDGVTLLATDAPLSSDTVYALEGLGSAIAMMSDKDADALRKEAGVAEVIEDFEVVALGDQNGYGLDTEAYQGMGTEEVAATTAYYQAYADAFAEFRQQLEEFLGNLDLRNGAAQFTPHPDGPLPRPPFPPLPLPPRLPLPTPRLPIPTPPILLPKQPIPWNIAMVKAPASWTRSAYGAGIKVGILDTGIANHPDLVIYGGASFIPGVSSYNDGNGHGTHVAGIVGARHNHLGVVGVAPQCHLYAVKVLSDAGSGQLSWILAGMAWARQNGMQVINMSLGSEQPTVAAYTTAIQQCLAAGMVVVTAAGNSFLKQFKFVNAPANSPGTIAVAAVNQNGMIADFSSRGGAGNQVTISAPGVRINSTHLANGYRVSSGTSMAAPHVTGAVALIRRRFPTWTPLQVRHKLVTTATDLGFPGVDLTYGAGLVNCNLATM